MVFVVLLVLPFAIILYFMNEISMNVFNFDLMAKLTEHTDMLESWLEENYDTVVMTENFLMEVREYIVELTDKF